MLEGWAAGSVTRTLVGAVRCGRAQAGSAQWQRRGLHASASAWQGTVTTPFLLADIGEGIKEVEVLQWHVKVGDAVEEFDPVVEVHARATVPTLISEPQHETGYGLTWLMERSSRAFPRKLS